MRGNENICDVHYDRKRCDHILVEGRYQEMHQNITNLERIKRSHNTKQ